MRKKLVVVGLLLFLVNGLVLADNKYEITQKEVLRLDSHTVQVNAEIKNISKKSIYLTDSTITLVDKQGNIINNFNNYKAVPNFIDPGGYSYISGVLKLETNINPKRIKFNVRSQEIKNNLLVVRPKNTKVNIEKVYDLFLVSANGFIKNDLPLPLKYTRIIIPCFNKKRDLLFILKAKTSTKLKPGDKIYFTTKRTLMIKNLDINKNDIQYKTIVEPVNSSAIF